MRQTKVEKAILLFICIAFAPGNMASSLRERIAVGPGDDKAVPFVAILNGIGEAKCYGVLITKQAILTTEKCAEFCHKNIVTCQVQFASQSVLQSNQEFSVKKVVQHQDNDSKLAVLIARDGPVYEGITIQDEVLPDNLDVTVAGLDIKNDVQTKQIKVSKNSERNLYCFENTEAYSCKDEGAPMYMGRNLIGIASNEECSKGTKCYLAVQPHRQWILSTSKNFSTRFARAASKQDNGTATEGSTSAPQSTTPKGSACLTSISLMSLIMSAICKFAF